MKKLDLTYANKGLKPKLIAVHDGRFHVDDVFAAMLMRSMYPEAKIIRTRDKSLLDSADIVIDVGSIYNYESLRFDHHQEGKAGERENGVQFSGFGLVWKHWGINICKGDGELYDEIDVSLVQPIDAGDNGQLLYSNQEPNFEGVKEVTIGMLVSILNNSNPKKLEDYDDNFEQALDFAEIVFYNFLLSKESLLQEKEKILESYSTQSDPRFMIDESYRPVLRYLKYMPELLYYLFPRDNTDLSAGWMMKCAKDESKVDNWNRKNLPNSWAGKSGEELELASGIKNMDFCHNNLFICGSKTKEAILEALDAALAN